MSTTVTCPTCGGPLSLDDSGKARCLVGHEVAPDDVPVVMEAVTTRALWTAIRSLEDAASGARWRQSRPDPPAWLSRALDEAERDALVLRELLGQREASAVNSVARPDDW